MSYVMFKKNTCMVVANQGFREFFQTKGYRPCLRVEGGNLNISADGELTVKNGVVEIQQYLNSQDGDSYFKFPRGVRKYILNSYKKSFTVDHLVKFFATEGKELVQKLMDYFLPDSDEQKYKKVFDKMVDKDLLKLFHKFEDTVWYSSITERLVRLYPRRILPLLMSTPNARAREALDKRIREGI